MRQGASVPGAVQKAPHSGRYRFPMLGLGKAAVAAAAAAVMLGVCAPARAQLIPDQTVQIQLLQISGPSLADVLFGGRHDDSRHETRPPVARYVAEEGDSFVLDLSGDTPMLKFEDSPEVWALQSQPAARGDVIYKNDIGEPMLRATRLGGLTLFTPERPGGAAAALEGQAPPLRPVAMMSPGQLLQRLAQASLRASRAAQRLVPFDAPDVTAGAEAVYADAALVAADAIGQLARRADAHVTLARFGKVMVTQGRKPSVALQEHALHVTVAPKMGIAGRPSSEKIIRAVAR